MPGFDPIGTTPIGSEGVLARLPSVVPTTVALTLNVFPPTILMPSTLNANIISDGLGIQNPGFLITGGMSVGAVSNKLITPPTAILALTNYIPVVSTTNTDFTLCFFTVRNALRQPQPNITFNFMLLDVLNSSDSWGTKVIQTATSDINGLVQISLLINAKWRMTGPDGHWIVFVTTKQSTFHIPYYIDKNF